MMMLRRGGNGQTWATAYKYLQDALAIAGGGNDIWVAVGTYYPDANNAVPGGSDDRTATFQLINGVGVYGGFSTGGGDWNSRDPNAYETILSGDINTPDVNMDNSYHVVTGSGTEPNAILDGFTITAGNANGSDPANLGGGMHNDGGSPTVANCTFIGNSAEGDGGGVFNMADSSPTLTNSILWGNTASDGNEIALYDSSTIDVNYCDIKGGQTDIYNDGTGTVNWGSGNIDEDPLFVGPNGLDGIGGTADDEEDNVHLRGYSPCINAGDPGGDYAGQTDIDGQPRVAYGRVDMGADEVFPIAGDVEPDGDVDFYDFGYFANNWLVGL